ncbi:hypothetical protein GQ43DRAFT_416695 [Delitschia confertaspora ATCC 74209]|uniref:Nuclear condensin complex subunit 3 C-terminal domain-containing protein n=1 Tax=Delitschia confertaspora ATCC 74209 TaxID=1513339 RepID=A0A9P4MS26_9PLEO|nr:hypothetical protein GQ43DRAFT_416695 [Delitschia confertaspora ATCC 74209]
MPGRVAGRSARSSAASATRKSATRASSNAVEVPDEGPTTSLRTQICSIFADAQRTTATQRKLVITLRKVQEASCYEPPNPKKKKQQEEDFGEPEFNEEVGRCVLRVFTVKKSEPVGDRIIRFLGLFLKHASEKDNVLAQSDDTETDAFPETPSSRLTSHILSLALALLTAKDKVVRFRATQMIAHIVNTLDSIDDELFQVVKLGLLKRLRDKETAVRVQAVLGLGRLADEDGGDDDEDSDDDSSGAILEKLLDVMQNDPSAEVRRSLLLNLPFTPSTLPYLLERARDFDPATRRALYSRLLPALGDFRHLSLTHREKLLRWGLRDRDENVRKATARLFRERWIEDCAGTQNAATEDGKPVGVAPPSYDALLELLERIDIVNSGVENGIALEAIREFWDGRPDYRDFIAFDDDFWNDLTPESAFVARSFNDYCRLSGDNKLQDTVEEKMPEVTKFAFFVQKHLNILIEDVRKIALQEQDDAEVEEDTVQQEFCVEQLLHIALSLDYSDEVGRRQMFSIMREALALAELPEECTKLVVEVLRAVCGSREAGEREFCGVVLEAIAEVHDTIMGEDAPEQNADESFHSARSELSDESTPKKGQSKKKGSSEDTSEMDEEKAIREIMVNMKCLHIAQCMLQNVHSDLEQNSALVTMLNNLVVPAVRSQEAPIRERGLICLGLCCLLSKNLASENLTLFLHCFSRGHESLQTISIQIITDILITHPSLLAPPTPDVDETATDARPPTNPLLKPLTKTFLKALASPSATIPYMSCVAASKLLLMGVLPAQSAAEILKAFTLAYFNPETASDPALRQALSYFLPVFCHSRLSNALLMAQISVGIIGKLVMMREELEEEDEEMVGWAIVAGMIAEWTDGRKVVGANGSESGVEGCEEPHLVLAVEILERCLGGASRDERKPLLTLLGKLHVALTSSAMTAAEDQKESLRTLHALVTEAVENKLGADATSRNLLAKLEVTLTKRLGDVDPTVLAQTTVVGDETKMEVEDDEVGKTEVEEEDVDGKTGVDDTMLTEAQAEGTRYPLGGSEDEDEELQSQLEAMSLAEDSVVDRLLESEDEELL